MLNQIKKLKKKVKKLERRYAEKSGKPLAQARIMKCYKATERRILYLQKSVSLPGAISFHSRKIKT